MNALDIKTLLPELKKQVTLLSEDLLKRVNAHSEINSGLLEAFHQIEKGGRTSQAYEVWLEDYLDQVAVAWVLACVFVRYLEDNGLVEECWLAGEGERRKLAEDTHEFFFRENPRDSDREYFLHVFREVGTIPAAADLFAQGKTPLWAVAPSGDAAMNLLKFWRERKDGEEGTLKRSFQVANGDTRFLGDLYQDLSERAKKKFALLQTPVFVEEFILDRTLTPAIAEFGLATVRMIDPTCGSGHFLLGGFARLFELWSKPVHTSGNAEKDAQKALDGIWGVDINPFAVAIARFRLIVAALFACSESKIRKAPGWKIHLATGDSLLMGSRFSQDTTGSKEQLFFETENEGSWAPEIFACEDRQAIQEILGQPYHAVVGNPPYIVVRDSKLNAAYRERYPKVCHRQYSLGVPFTERFFDLGEADAEGKCGYVGMITANSFMKREFGKKLIEDFFPKIDLTHVIDTQGAYIPGHGTPTVILLGRNRKPVGNSVRAAFGIRGEPTTPVDPSKGFVWQSIISQLDRVGSKNEFISTDDVSRTTFAKHPWSIGGGGASDLKELLDESESTLGTIGSDIGFLVITGEDNCLVLEPDVLRRVGVANKMPLVLGDEVRDWCVEPKLVCLWPNDQNGKLLSEESIVDHLTFCWPYRSVLKSRKAFGVPVEQKGIPWWGLRELYSNRLRTPLTITFAFVATHNHFVLDRGGKVFNRSAPIIKLPADATADDHLGLLGLLNSSTACFWMQQTLHNKGGPGGGSSKDEKWHDFYEFSGTALKQFPIPNSFPTVLATRLDQEAQALRNCLPVAIIDRWNHNDDLAEQLRLGQEQANAIRLDMISLQEELDWRCYEYYDIWTDSEVYEGSGYESLELGQRAFEIHMARQICKGTLNTKWFEWLNIKPITELPEHWKESYRRMVERRIQAIEKNGQLALIERPDCKRRWESETWHDQEQRALKNWLLDRLEKPSFREGGKVKPELTTTAQIADMASADSEFQQVATLYRGRNDFDVAKLVGELIEGESVPFLPILRYKPTGLRKREVWERTWELQRDEDAGKTVGNIPVPPKYATADFVKTDFWRLRGKLDVPKERWIRYSHCSTDSDPSLVVGWAGWNHLEQATALVSYYDARKREGWEAERLKPLLAGLDQLIPWIHQWHPEIDPEYGETAGQSFQHMLETDAHELGLTLDEIRAWVPPTKTTKSAAKPKGTEKQPRKPRKKPVESENAQ